MSKRLINILQISVGILALGILVFLMVFYKLNETSYNAALYLVMVYGMVNVLFLLIRVLNKLEIKRLTGAIHASYVVIAVVFHYALSYLGGYERFYILYWALLFGVSIVTVVVMTIMNFKLKPQKPVAVTNRR